MLCACACAPMFELVCLSRGCADVPARVCAAHQGHTTAFAPSQAGMRLGVVIRSLPVQTCGASPAPPHPSPPSSSPSLECKYACARPTKASCEHVRKDSKGDVEGKQGEGLGSRLTRAGSDHSKGFRLQWGGMCNATTQLRAWESPPRIYAGRLILHAQNRTSNKRTHVRVEG